ncbi:MAG: Dihydroflavonol-4-reductase [Fibrobacteres bacterium]|nr:Dihydroflavonol-4-reductase [Fibrobacterota bacterium]
MKTIVFGSTGQIGHALIKNLSDQSGDEFSIAAVKRKGSRVGFPNNVETIEVERLERDSFSRILEGADHAIYAIGSPEKWVNDPDFFRRINVDLLKVFLEGLRDHPKVSLTYFSTFEVFKPIDGIIRESAGVESKGTTPYYQSMIDAFNLVKEHESKYRASITTFHPAAVYGGLNTGLGITNYLMNIKERRYLGTPSILPGHFPIVHVDSLASAVIKALRGSQFGNAFNVSDAFVSLKELAKAAKNVHKESYQPFELPAGLVRFSAFVMDLIADTITKSPPILSSVQVKFITQSHDMDCAKAASLLGWSPMPIIEGIRRQFAK